MTQININPLAGLDRSKNKEISEARVRETLERIHPKQKTYILESVPISSQKLFSESFDGSRAKAIKAKCQSCTNFSKDDISNCTVFICPLHTVRPYQSKEDIEDNE